MLLITIKWSIKICIRKDIISWISKWNEIGIGMAYRRQFTGQRRLLNWTKITIKLKINLKSMQKCEKKTIRRSNKYLRLFSWCDLILFFFLKVIFYFSHIVSFNSVLTDGDTRCTYTQIDTHTQPEKRNIFREFYF